MVYEDYNSMRWVLRVVAGAMRRVSRCQKAQALMIVLFCAEEQARQPCWLGRDCYPATMAENRERRLPSCIF